MKLTEQQLAQLFKQGKAHCVDSGIHSGIHSDVDSLLNSTAASDKRINDVEKIANSNMLSASYQVINQLKDWSKDVSTDLNNELNKPSVSSSFFTFTWLKPTLATAVLAVGVYFIIPNLDPSVNPVQTSPNPTNSTMFSGNFEIGGFKKGKQQVLPTKPQLKSDVIYKGGFG
ncbi:MAG: hypothetical protein L3J83_05355 [Proteobacteria bacterium]|nr:hypothetical protein [Pseudomonadota bacterium]